MSNPNDRKIPKFRDVLFICWCCFPFGNIGTFKYEQYTVTINKQWWLTLTTDDGYSDMLPIGSVSETLAKAALTYVQDKWHIQLFEELAEEE